MKQGVKVDVHTKQTMELLLQVPRSVTSASLEGCHNLKRNPSRKGLYVKGHCRPRNVQKYDGKNMGDYHTNKLYSTIHCLKLRIRLIPSDEPMRP